MDMMAGCGDVSHQAVDHFLIVSEQFDRVPSDGRKHVDIFDQLRRALKM